MTEPTIPTCPWCRKPIKFRSDGLRRAHIPKPGRGWCEGSHRSADELPVGAGPRRITMRDNNVAHQVRVFLQQGTHKIAVSCVCLLDPDGPSRYRPLDSRVSWAGDDLMTVWRSHMADVEAAEAAS